MEILGAIWQDFHFLRPLWLLLLLPLAVFGWQRSARHFSGNGWQAHIDNDLLEHLLVEPGGSRSNTVWQSALHFLLPASLCVAIVALAGPSWERTEQPAFQTEDKLIIIADLTLSMHAEDLPPSRFTRLRYKLLELLKQRREGQTALVVYSGDAHLLSPLTEDSETIAALVPALSPEIMPGIGSNAASAFELAATLIDENTSSNPRIAWFTDQLLERDQRVIESIVRQTGAELFIVGIGTASGGPVPLPSGKFLLDAKTGTPVTARLNSDAMRSLASQLNGSYLPLQTDNGDIATILQRGAAGSSLKSNTSGDQQTLENWQDRGGWLLPLLLPALLMSFRRGWLLSIPAALPLIALLGFSMPVEVVANDNTADRQVNGSAMSQFWDSLWRNRNQRAHANYDAGEYAQATETFSDPDWRAASNYQQGNYADASEAFKQQLATLQADPEASARAKADAHYNSGHAQARLGDLEAAIDAYRQALDYDSAFAEAQTALDLVESLLQQQEQQEQQDQQQQDSDGEQGNPPQQDQRQQGQNGESTRQEQQQAQSASDQNAETETSTQPQGQQQQERKRQDGQKPASPQQAEDNKQRDDEAEAEAFTHSETGEQSDEKLQQWLRQVDDDPSGLIRRKFQYQREQRERDGTVVEQGDNPQLW